MSNKEHAAVQEIRNVAILGAGAMGSVLAWLFDQAPDLSVSVVAKGERYDRLRRDGLTVNDATFHVPVIHPDRVEAPADLIIVALKHHHLDEAVPYLRDLVGPETTLISVMNGLDSEAILGEAYGMEKVLLCISVGIDALRQGRCVTYTTPGKLYLGEAGNRELSPRVRRVQEALGRASIPYETPPDMVRMLWWKFMVNVGVNQASAVTRAPYGVFQTSPDARALMFGLMREVIALAAEAGVDLVEADLDAWDAFLQTLSPAGKTSMLQDVEAGRKTEVEIFAGKAVELGKSYGITTPMNAMVLHIIRVLEAAEVESA
jgi:2-dehydropantoate 2-reductase